MKIHSSSLTFSPARINQQQTAKNNNAQQNEKTALSAAGETQSLLRIYPLDKIQKTSETAAANLDSAKQENTYQPTDKRTLTALNAYQQEFNQVLQARHADLITGVDTYA